MPASVRLQPAFSDTTALQLVEKPPRKVVNEEDEVKNAMKEQRLAEKFQAHMLGTKYPARPKSETKQMFAKEQKMAAREFAADVADSQQSLVSESSENRIDSQMIRKERAREASFHESEQQYSKDFQQALQKRRAKENADYIPLGKKANVNEKQARIMHEKMQQEARHMDSEVDAIMGIGGAKHAQPQAKAKAKAAKAKAQHMPQSHVLRDRKGNAAAHTAFDSHLAAQMALISGSGDTSGAQGHAAALKKVEAMGSKLAKLHAHIKAEIQDQKQRERDPMASSSHVIARQLAARAQQEKLARNLKQVELNPAVTKPSRRARAAREAGSPPRAGRGRAGPKLNPKRTQP